MIINNKKVTGMTYYVDVPGKGNGSVGVSREGFLSIEQRTQRSDPLDGVWMTFRRTLNFSSLIALKCDGRLFLGLNFLYLIFSSHTIDVRLQIGFSYSLWCTLFFLHPIHRLDAMQGKIHVPWLLLDVWDPGIAVTVTGNGRVRPGGFSLPGQHKQVGRAKDSATHFIQEL